MKIIKALLYAFILIAVSVGLFLLLTFGIVNYPNTTASIIVVLLTVIAAYSLYNDLKG